MCPTLSCSPSGSGKSTLLGILRSPLTRLYPLLSHSFVLCRPSGSGKSTLLDTLSGRKTVGNLEVRRLAARICRIGQCGQALCAGGFFALCLGARLRKQPGGCWSSAFNPKVVSGVGWSAVAGNKTAGNLEVGAGGAWRFWWVESCPLGRLQKEPAPPPPPPY